jgi:hypothetical protein
MSNDSIKDEDRITRRDLLQANATLITGVLIFITLFDKRETITSESIAFFAASLIGFFYSIYTIISNKYTKVAGFTTLFGVLSIIFSVWYITIKLVGIELVVIAIFCSLFALIFIRKVWS